jgi:hypothetical protein
MPLSQQEEGDIGMIEATGVYTVEAAARSIGLPVRCLANAIRAGDLRHARKARMNLVIGQWVIDWIAAAEVDRPRRTDGREG